MDHERYPWMKERSVRVAEQKEAREKDRERRRKARDAIEAQHVDLVEERKRKDPEFAEWMRKGEMDAKEWSCQYSPAKPKDCEYHSYNHCDDIGRDCGGMYKATRDGFSYCTYPWRIKG